jgi:hypothetical protein
MVFFIPSIQFYFGLPRALFKGGNLPLTKGAYRGNDRRNLLKASPDLSGFSVIRPSLALPHICVCVNLQQTAVLPYNPLHESSPYFKAEITSGNTETTLAINKFFGTVYVRQGSSNRQSWGSLQLRLFNP